MCRHRGAPSASPQVSDRPAGGGVGAEVFQLISGARDGRRAGGVTLFVEDEKLESLLPLPKLERKMFATLPPLVLKLLLLKVLLPRLLPCPLLCPCFERWRECLCALVPGCMVVTDGRLCTRATITRQPSQISPRRLISFSDCVFFRLPRVSCVWVRVCRSSAGERSAILINSSARMYH